MTQAWIVETLPWDRLDPSRVSPELLALVKAAALVEYNGQDYSHYLCGVFHDDALFQQVAVEWAREEVQHGVALGTWAERVDPSWNFKEAVARFRAGYRVDTAAQTSLRGSRSGELVSRCIVETGTSSYYTALSEAGDEPVLQAICRNIASDEFRHYKLFYDHLKRYQQTEPLGRLARLKIALSRIAETEDDELSFAWHAANSWTEPYDRRRSFAAYARRAYGCYRRSHVETMVAMVLKASGLAPRGVLHRLASGMAWRRIARRAAA